MKAIYDEGLQQVEKYQQRPALNWDLCQKAVAYVLRQIDANLAAFTVQFPAPASKKLFYPALDNSEWTSSFWTGMLWLAYELTGKEHYSRIAAGQLSSYQQRLAERQNTDTHDLGFLYTLSAVAEYKLTGNPAARQTALQAADLLITRYFEPAGIIQAWGDLSDPEQRGRMIIDCCMNLPLLYWATQETGNPAYRRIAARHAEQAAAYLVRDDASTYHTFFMDVTTGEPRYGKTAQGYSDTSCWSRGQAWGIYGFVLNYVYTRDIRFLELSQTLAHYFLNRLPEDAVCYWDLCFTNGNEERDSSAAAIAACGLLELAKHLSVLEPKRTYYENAALQIIHSLTQYYTTQGTVSNGVLLHAVYGKPWNAGVDECVIWGDYFYLEALMRLLKDWKAYW